MFAIVDLCSIFCNIFAGLNVYCVNVCMLATIAINVTYTIAYHLLFSAFRMKKKKNDDYDDEEEEENDGKWWMREGIDQIRHDLLLNTGKQ